MKELLAVLLMIAVVAFGPSLLFWCIETLFDHSIELTWRTWLAGLLVIGLFAS